MLNIDDPTITEKTPAILRLGFRPFFLGGAYLATLYIPLWLLSWFTPQYSFFDTGFWAQIIPIWWHPHEMLFGFAFAIACGFLLTAVQTWTNQPSLSGLSLAIVFNCWLLARILLLFPFSLPLWLPALFDSLFIGLTSLKLWLCIYKVKQWRNIIFPIMLIFALVINLVSYFALYERNFTLSNQIWQGMIWWFGLLITIVGGRVIPFFTSMRLKSVKPEPVKLIENALILSMILLIAQGATKFFSTQIEQVLLIITAVIHFARWIRWQPHKTLAEPLLWSLQISYLFLPVTLIALAWNIDNINAYRHLLHLFAIGCIAGICLSMISRVSLGHTSRNIYQGPNMTLAFIAIFLAAIFRSIVPLLLPEYSQTWLWLSGGFWSLAFGMFVWYYTPILSRPRIDGRPG